MIVAEFEVREPIKASPLIWPELVRKTCVSMQDAGYYAAGKQIWFWDINNMVDYCSMKGHRIRNVSEFGLKRAPQSWCYVEEL